jgi:hypothetical protein
LAAAGNQIGRTLFALMASGADNDPDHETKRRTTKHQKEVVKRPSTSDTGGLRGADQTSFPL